MTPERIEELAREAVAACPRLRRLRQIDRQFQFARRRGDDVRALELLKAAAEWVADQEQRAQGMKT